MSGPGSCPEGEYWDTAFKMCLPGDDGVNTVPEDPDPAPGVSETYQGNRKSRYHYCGESNFWWPKWRDLEITTDRFEAKTPPGQGTDALQLTPCGSSGGGGTDRCPSGEHYDAFLSECVPDAGNRTLPSMHNGRAKSEYYYCGEEPELYTRWRDRIISTDRFERETNSGEGTAALSTTPCGSSGGGGDSGGGGSGGSGDLPGGPGSCPEGEYFDTAFGTCLPMDDDGKNPNDDPDPGDGVEDTDPGGSSGGGEGDPLAILPPMAGLTSKQTTLAAGVGGVLLLTLLGR